jgi:hypothetical protein
MCLLLWGSVMDLSILSIWIESYRSTNKMSMQRWGLNTRDGIVQRLLSSRVEVRAANWKSRAGVAQALKVWEPPFTSTEYMFASGHYLRGIRCQDSWMKHDTLNQWS